jgi:hypothetical protein
MKQLNLRHILKYLKFINLLKLPWLFNDNRYKFLNLILIFNLVQRKIATSISHIDGAKDRKDFIIISKVSLPIHLN